MENGSSTSGLVRSIQPRLNYRFLTGYVLDRIAAWITSLTATVLAFQLSGSIPIAAAVILVIVLGRAFAMSATRATHVSSPVVLLAAIIRVGAVAGLILFEAQSDIWWVLVLLGVVGITSGIIDSAFSSLMPMLGARRDVPLFNRAVGRCEQIAAIAGPLLVAGMVGLFDHRLAFAVAAVAMYATLIVLRRLLAERRLIAPPDDNPAYRDNPFVTEEWAWPANARLVLTGLVAMAALGVLVRLTLLDRVVGDDASSVAAYAIMLAIVGVGALPGPLPVDRLLGHFPVGLILAGAVSALAVTAIFIGIGGPLLIVIPALLAVGITIVTTDLASAVAVRRAIPERRAREVSRQLAQLLFAGQAFCLVAVMILASTWSSATAAVSLSVLCMAAVTVHFLQAGRNQTNSLATSADTDRATTSGSTTGQG